MKSTTLSYEEACELVHYDPEFGRFFWKLRSEKWFTDGYHSAKGQANRWNLKWAGKETFLNCNTTGYPQARINGIMVCAHRLAWLIMTGTFNETDIDHIDGNKKNNKWSNFRLVNRSENCRNKSKRSDNSSGITGISLKKSSGKWQAYIYHERHIHLGYFDSIEEAIKVRKEAEKNYGYHENHGRE